MTRADRIPGSLKSLAIATDFRKRLMSGVPVVGAWTMVPHSNVVEVMARLQFDFLLLDGEHSSMSAASLSGLLPAAELHGSPSIFRPRSHMAPEIKAALDAGASGVMIPMIDTAHEALAVVSRCRYAPVGQRGIGPWRASGFYDDFDSYLRRANDATTVLLQIESVTGLANVEEIADVEGFDALYVGPADLASSLGLPVGDQSAPMRDALRKVASAARRSGKIAGIDLSDLEAVPDLLEMGFSFFTTGSDLSFIQKAGRSLVSEMSERVAGVSK